MVDEHRLARLLGEFAHHLIAGYEVSDILHQLSGAAVTLLPIDGAGIMLRGEGGSLKFATATDECTSIVEQLQIHLGQGPCMTAASSGQPVLVADLRAGDPRFLNFCGEAVRRGMRAAFAFPMAVPSASSDASESVPLDIRIGALNLYRGIAGPLPRGAIDAAQLLADVASAYIVNNRTLTRAHDLVGQLQQALDSCIVIEQAEGKICAQLGVDPDTAFEMLRRHARTTHTHLRAVSRAVMEGALPVSELVPQHARTPGAS